MKARFHAYHSNLAFFGGDIRIDNLFKVGQKICIVEEMIRELTEELLSLDRLRQELGQRVDANLQLLHQLVRLCLLVQRQHLR